MWRYMCYGDLDELYCPVFKEMVALEMCVHCRHCIGYQRFQRRIDCQYKEVDQIDGTLTDSKPKLLICPDCNCKVEKASLKTGEEFMFCPSCEGWFDAENCKEKPEPHYLELPEDAKVIEGECLSDTIYEKYRTLSILKIFEPYEKKMIKIIIIPQKED